MYSPTNDAALPAPGFPIRRSAGQRLFSASPRLIAAVHVLLRLLVPRHPPCALILLTVSCIRARGADTANTLYWHWVQFSSSAEAGRRGNPARGLSKLSSVAEPASSTKLDPAPITGPVDVSRDVPASEDALPGRAAPRRDRLVELPRKEVIQPQLPLRLPCYDFTPITGPTFDGSLPKGLGHRLRVLLAFVV
jgi:hypothetical protein